MFSPELETAHARDAAREIDVVLIEAAERVADDLRVLDQEVVGLSPGVARIIAVVVVTAACASGDGSDSAEDLVLGPARDGGYYLAGMKRLHRRIFEGIAYGESDVFSLTVAAAEREGLRWSTVAALDDLDTLADLERLERSGLFRNSR